MKSAINIVLFQPIYPRNIGMCARAMANMGTGRLVIVAPQCELTDEAKQGAAHAQEILRSAAIYQTPADFFANEGSGLRIALSGIDGRLRTNEDFKSTLKTIAADPEHPFSRHELPLYLFFGSEDGGLSDEEMRLCHHICRLPTFSEISSLNISHAVLLALYMVRENLLSQSDEHLLEPLAIKPPPAYYPAETIRSWLEALGFDLSAKKVTIEKTLNRILLSRCPTDEELRIVDSVLQQTIRKLKP